MKNLRDFVLAGLLLAIGLILHSITPSTGTMVKPDFILSMLFICLLLFDDLSVGFIAGVAAGILSGLTTSLAGGLIPNIVDKIITTSVFIGIIYSMRKFISTYILSIVVPILGTLFSGTVFLSTAIFLKVLPEEAFLPAFITAVLPAVVVNTVLVAILFGALKQTTRLYHGKRKTV